MFNKFITWAKSKLSKSPPAEPEVGISQQTADQVIDELLSNIDYEREQHFEQVAHLDTLMKSILLSQGGSLIVSKDFIEMVTNQNYRLQVTEVDDSFKLDLMEAGDEDEEGEE